MISDVFYTWEDNNPSPNGPSKENGTVKKLKRMAYLIDCIIFTT